MIKLVVFDLDNVLIDTESLDEIAKIKGIEDEISVMTLEAMEGKVPFETSIRERVKKFEGIDVNDIDKVVENIPLNPGAVETVEELKNRGYTVAIITGGFDVIASKIKDIVGADYACYNTIGVTDGKLNGEISGPLVSNDKIVVLKELIEELGITLDECAAIGDGANDLEMIKQSKLGIGYNAKPIVRENADVLINQKDLRMVLDIMADEEKILENEEIVENETTEEAPVEEVEEVPEEEAVAEDAEADEDATEEVVESDEEEVSEEAEEVSEAEDAGAEDAGAEEATEETKEDAPAEESTIDYSKLNFQQLLEVKRTLESELTELKNSRDQMNEETKQFRQERDELNQELKDTLQIALDKRNERDEINKQVRENKDLRNECNEKLKKLEWNSGKKEISNIQAEINKIDKTIQTKVLDIRKENELVKRVSTLTKQLKEIQHNEEDEKDADELKEKSEEYHKNVVELSDKAQAVHEEMIEYFNKIDGIREKADEKHQEFINSRKNATAKHEEVKNKLSEIRKVNKCMDQAKSKSKGRRSHESEDSDVKEKEAAEEIFQRFKDGKKLTTDEFLLLQKYNIM